MNNSLFPEYTLENAREFGSLVRVLFNQSSFDEATMDASSEMEETGDEGRVKIFVPHGMTLKPDHFYQLIEKAHSQKLEIGEASSGKAIYGKRNDAFHGKTIAGKHHPGFLVYDTATTLIVDLIDRKGRSQVNPAIREQYHSALEKELGYSVDPGHIDLAQN